MQDQEEPHLFSEDETTKAFFYDKYRINLTGKQFAFHNDKQKYIWNNIAKNQMVTVVDSTEDRVEEFLLEYIGTEIKDYCNDYTANNWNDPLTDEALDLLILKNNHFIVSGKEITPLHVYNFLWASGELPLLLQATNPHEYEDILNSISSNSKLKLLILNKSGLHSTKILDSIRDLDEINRLELLKCPVTFQGRCSVPLESIISEDMFDYVESSDVIKILLNDFNIGEEAAKPLPQSRRNVSKVFFSCKVLDKVKDQVFLIEDCGGYFFDMDIQNYNVRKLKEFGEVDFINPNCRIIISKRPILEEELNKFKSTSKMVHFLKTYNRDLLEWQYSFGELYKLKDCIVELEDEWEKDLNNLLKRHFNVITGCIGESTFLDYVAHQLPSDKWVMQVNLQDFPEYLEEDACKSWYTKSSVHLNYFQKRRNCSKLTDAIFQRFLDAKNIIVLLDGIDEVVVSNEDEVTNLINSLQKDCQMWLTGNQRTKRFLVNEFDGVAVTLQPFDLLNNQTELETSEPIDDDDDDEENSGDNNPSLHSALLDSTTTEEILEKLILEITDINLQNKEGNTSLHLSLSKHKPRIAKILINKGADVNIRNKKGETALHLAAHGGYDDIINQMLPSIPDINRKDYYGRSCLFYTTHKNKIETCRLLISLGVDLHMEDVIGETVLHRAANNSCKEIIELLLNNGAEIDKKDNNGCTPLYYAMYANDVDTFKLLISKGANVHVESNNETPLHDAAYGNYTEIVTELLSHGVDINKEDYEGNAPLFYAARAGSMDTLKLLISSGASVNHQNKDGEMALHRAAWYGSTEIVRELVINGANVNKVTHFGFTPLHLALLENETDTVNFLIANGACVDIDSKDGEIDKALHKYF